MDIDEADGFILSLIAAAREYCENFTGRALAVQGMKHTLMPSRLAAQQYSFRCCR
ncbi:head-tail connector protein [Sporomusa carbonis]|uniref:head-tail connector protein n=1 Tax=Sporomusa carbonis TaxID=3076075 RepID=UPI003C7E2401